MLPHFTHASLLWCSQRETVYLKKAGIMDETENDI
jgi:hypothetical protein